MQRLVADYGLAWVRVEVVKPITSEGYTAAITIERGQRRAKLVLRGGVKAASVRDVIKRREPDRCGRTATGEQQEALLY